MIARSRLFTIAALIGAMALGAASHSSAQTPRINELRAQIAANPQSYERGAWQLELAERLLATLSVDGADTSALYGVPTFEQEERVRQRAAEALALSQAAATELQRGAAALIEHPEFADRRDLQDLRSALSVEMAMIRQPLAEGRAAALLSQLGDGSLEPTASGALQRVEAATPMTQARRFATLGAMQSGHESINEIRDFATPDRIRDIRDQSPHLARELMLARARAEDWGRLDVGYLEEQIELLGNDDVLDQFALREAIAAWTIASRNIDTPQNVGVELTFGGVFHDASLANLVVEKCCRLIQVRRDPSEYAPIDRIAYGRQALAQGNSDAAVNAFRSAWSELGDEFTIFKRLCGWDLARALRERGAPQDIANAGAVLLELAQLPNEPNAEQALTSSIQLLQWSDRALAQIGAERATVSASLREALRLGLRTWPNAASADEWRLALANVVAGAEQRDLLESISPRSEAFPRARLALAWLVFAEFDGAPSDAQREALAFTMLQFADQAQETAAQFDLDAQDDFLASVQQARAVALVELRRFQAAAEAAIAWDGLDGRSEPDAVTIVRQRMGDALRESFLIRDAERAAAIATTLEALCAAAFQRIIADASPRSTVDGAAIDLTDALGALDLEDELLSRTRAVAEHVGVTRGVGIAQATGLRAQGANAEAFQTLRDVVDASRVLEVTDNLYWRAWARMLEILADQNQDGARTESIRRQIARLRAEDRALGGELTRRRIDAVETQLQRVTAAP